MQHIKGVVLILLITGCARGYHPIVPEELNYNSMQQAGDSISISYTYNAHESFKNKPYARKERKADFKLITLKVNNNKDEYITLNTDNLLITTDSGDTIYTILQENYSEKIRQKEELFILFYGLAGLGASASNDSYDGFSLNLSYNPIPLAIGALNALYAGSSNRKHERNLSEEYILYRRINARSSAYGLLVVYTGGDYPDLNFYFQDK